MKKFIFVLILIACFVCTTFASATMPDDLDCDTNSQSYWDLLAAEVGAMDAALQAGAQALEDANLNYEDSGWWGNWSGTAPDCVQIANTMSPPMQNALLQNPPDSFILYQVTGCGYWFLSWHTYFLLVTPWGTYVLDPWYYNDTDLHPVDIDDLPYPPSYMTPLNNSGFTNMNGAPVTPPYTIPPSPPPIPQLLPSDYLPVTPPVPATPPFMP